jgi:hypothetical protein
VAGDCRKSARRGQVVGAIFPIFRRFQLVLSIKFGFSTYKPIALKDENEYDENMFLLK